MGNKAKYSVKYLLFFFIFNIHQIYSNDYYVYGTISINNPENKENPLIVERNKNKINILVPVIIKHYKTKHETLLKLSIDCFLKSFFCCKYRNMHKDDIMIIPIGELKNKLVILDDSFEYLFIWQRDTLEQL